MGFTRLHEIVKNSNGESSKIWKTPQSNIDFLWDLLDSMAIITRSKWRKWWHAGAMFDAQNVSWNDPVRQIVADDSDVAKTAKHRSFPDETPKYTTLHQ